MTERVRRIGRRLIAFAAVVWLTSPTPRTAAQTPTATAPTVLRDLTAIAELQSLFDRESDRTRIVLLLSPT
jgi:hypothetical protein